MTAKRIETIGNTGQGSPDLRRDLRDFASARPEGWDHRDWVSFLDHLRERGHDTSDPDGIGTALEQERLAVVLERIQGVGPARLRSLVEQFGSLWNLRQAGAEQIANTTSVPRSLAERIQEAVR
jgi:hypothetical protein